MDTYSVIGDKPRPWLTFVGFSGDIGFMRQAEALGQAVLVSATYDGFSCLSALFGVKRSDGSMELFLYSRSGLSRKTSFDRAHHHVTNLTDNASAYAEALGVSTFYIRTSTRKAGFLSRRFKGWSERKRDGVNEATLKV